MKDGLRRELVDPAGVDRAGVELAPGVLAERREAADRDRLATHVRCRAADHAQAPDLAGAVVAEEVAPDRGWDGRAAIDEAAGNRTPVVVVRVGVDGECQRAGGA